VTDPAHAPDDTAVVERFTPTSGRFSGVVGLLTVGAILVVAVLDWDAGTPLGVGILAVLGAILVWSALLRPALWVTSRELVLRGMFSTTRVPLAAIDTVVVTQVLAVKVGDSRYASPVIGYTVRQTVKARVGRESGSSGRASGAQDHQAFVEARIAHLAQDARDRLGIRKGAPEQQALAADVRRTWAVPELVAVAVAVLAFVVWLVVSR
jgi:hypothetical protein